MVNILRSMASLLAGMLISALISLYAPLICKDLTLQTLIGFLIVFLLLYGFGKISPLRWLYKLKKKFFTPVIGILSDMGWDPSNKQIYTWTDVSPEDWRNMLEKLARSEGIKIKVKLISASKNFDPYTVVINPYGAVYPEYDLESWGVVNKILDYVRRGGLFVNVADIPCYYAYNPLLKKRLETAKPIYDITPDGKVLRVNPFELAPLMEKLGLRVLAVERTELSKWDAEFEEKFRAIMGKVGKIEVHRVAIVEENVEPIIKPREVTFLGSREKCTPLFFVNYGDGKFLISLIFLNATDNSKKMKEVLSKMIIEIAKKPLKQGKRDAKIN